jgi:biotin-(acetyl-CoA carboxylase) ligase
LLELKQTKVASYVLFGIGINLKLPTDVRDAIDQPVTDLDTLLQRVPDKSFVVARIIECLLKNLEEFEKSATSPLATVLAAVFITRGPDTLVVGEMLALTATVFFSDG